MVPDLRLDIGRQRHGQVDPSGPATALRKQLRRALDRRAGGADVGPVLRMADPRSPEALEEVTAAIQAMGP